MIPKTLENDHYRNYEHFYDVESILYLAGNGFIFDHPTINFFEYKNLGYSFHTILGVIQ